MTAARMEHLLSKIETDVKLLKWMAGFQVAVSAATLGILLRFVS